MTTTSNTLDSTSKRWLVILAAAMVVSLVILTRSFVNVLSAPDEMKPETVQPTESSVAQTSVTTQPQWNTQPESSSAVKRIRTHPTARRGSVKPPINEEVRKQMVHRQAEDLRTMVKQNKLPEAFGNLTLEKIDENEKNGIIIE